MSASCLLCTVVIAGAGCLVDQREDAADESERVCDVDDDCVIVDLGCANAGGAAVAVNRVSAADVQARAPTVAMPGSVEGGGDGSCGADAASCLAGQCTLIRSGGPPLP